MYNICVQFADFSKLCNRPINRDLWDYMSNLSIEMNRLTDSIKEDPDKIAIHLKTAPERRYTSHQTTSSYWLICLLVFKSISD